MINFGKRSVSEADDKSLTVAATLAVAAKPIGIPAIQSSAPAPQPASEPQRSDDYYVTKSMIFGALVEAIDLSQLSRLDAENAREEIRDIVHEIVAIKNVAVSTGEQEDLIDDICNDVLGYGPLEPLLGRDDIADIMVNGATRTFIEVGGKIQLTNIAFATTHN
jgi:pilus assembly protein CpaF